MLPHQTEHASLGGADAGEAQPRPDLAMALAVEGTRSEQRADRRDQPGGDREIHPGDREQTPHGRIVHGGFGNLTVQHGEVLTEAVEFAQVPRDRGALVVGEDLMCEPGPAGSIEQLGVRARRDQVCGQDRMGLVLHPGAMSDDLIAPRHQAAPAFGLGIRQPHLRQEPGRVQRCQDTGVDLIGLDVGVGNRLHLQRIGHDDACHMGAEHAHYRHRVAGGFEDHLVVRHQAAAEALEPRTGHVDPTVPPQPPVLPEHHLGERPMNVHTDHTPHPIPSSSWPRERWAARQLRIRARGATGRVAGAASY